MIRRATFAGGVIIRRAWAGDVVEKEIDPVREAQRALDAAGYDPGPADGILGPETKRALIHFQAVNGLELPGELDAATRARLLGKAA